MDGLRDAARKTVGFFVWVLIALMLLPHLGRSGLQRSACYSSSKPTEPLPVADIPEECMAAYQAASAEGGAASVEAEPICSAVNTYRQEGGR